MNHDWIVDISVNGQTEKRQILLSSQRDETNLNQNDISNYNTSDAQIYIDQDELVIERTGEASVEIERGNRKRLLKPAHPTRILPQDTIRMGSSEYRILAIYHANQPQRKTSGFGQFAGKALLTGAAAVMMTMLPACKLSEPSKNATSQVAEQQNDVKQDESAADTKPAIPDNNAPDSKDQECVAEDTVIAGGGAIAAAPVIREPSKCENAEITMMCLGNNRYQKCGDGRWELVEECKKPSECRTTYDKEVMGKVISTQCYNQEPCEDGHYACFGGRVNCEQNPGFGCSVNNEMYKCENHQWKLEKTCPSRQTCELDGDTKANCVEHVYPMGTPAFGNDCTDRNEKCDSENAIMFCHWGRWRYKKVCKDGEICKTSSGTTTAVCVPSDEIK